MRTLLPGTAEVLAGGVVGLSTLVLMQFPAANVALCSANFDLDWGGDTYRGANALGSVPEITTGPGEIKGLSFQLAGIDTAYLALALDDAAVVQGTPLTIRQGIVAPNLQLIDAPVVWRGKLDTMTIQEDGNTCSIQVTAEPSAVDLMRGAPLTYSDGDQRYLFPGDRAFEYVASQVNIQVVWPNAQWAAARGPR